MKRTAMILATLALVMLCLLTLPTQANAAETVASGTCGENLSWTLDNNGTLTISGTGTMTDFGYNGAPWYANAAQIEAVVIENGVTNIGGFAFRDCHSLTNVTIPDSVTSIVHCAFSNCTGLTEIVIPSSVIDIGDEAFVGCIGLTSIIIPNGVTSIGNYAFAYCDNLASIIIPDSVTQISRYVFEGCDNLKYNIYDNAQYLGNVENPYYILVEGTSRDITSVIIHEDTRIVGCDAFGACTGLTSIIIPDNVFTIGFSAFSNCTGLVSVTIGDNVKNIATFAFEHCTSLTEINIPVSVEKINDGAFSDSTKMIGIWVDENNPHYSSDSNGVLFNKDKTTLIQAPGGLNGEYIIPATVNNISASAFSGCADILSVVIGDGVISIGIMAFYGWTAEQNIYFAGTQTQWSAIAIGYGNDFLLNADIQFAVHYGQKQLALGADLSMDFYVAVSEAVANDENAVMQISLGGKVIDEIALKDAKQVEMDDEWYCWYVFTAEVPVKDITKEISLQLTDSTGNVGDAYTYSVKQYADYLLANSTDEKVLNICQTLLDYGAAAEKHFTVRACGTVTDSELANGGDFGTRLDGVTVPAAYAPTKSGNIDGITCYGTSLILEADTSIRLYFMTDAETWSNVEVAVDVVGAEYNVSQVTNGKAYIEITGIHAADLDTKYTVTLTRGEEHITICYSGLSYAWAVQNSSSSNETLCQMVKGLYKYWEAAEAYVKKDAPIPGENESDILPW